MLLDAVQLENAELQQKNDKLQHRLGKIAQLCASAPNQGYSSHPLWG